MIFKSNHNFFLYNFFKGYAKWKIKRNFDSVYIIGDIKKSQLPVLILSNHISWWDGFWAMYLNMKILKRKFHFMMLEEQLRKYWFFRYTGGFSVNKKSRSILESLNYTEEILSCSRNLVLFYPQGEIQSMHQQDFHFEKGIERVVNNKEGKIQIILMANLVDYFSNPKPSIYMYIKDFPETDFTIKNIQHYYNHFYRQCVENQKQLMIKM